MTGAAGGELLLGAVAYDPKVVTIWEGFRQWLGERSVPFDYVLYSHYDRQVDDLLAGHLAVAWNSPLAWVQARRRAPAAGVELATPLMRDTDRDLTSLVLVRAESEIDDLAGLRGRTVATGARDSPQATLLPLALLHTAGLVADRDFTWWPMDVGHGLHGDHVGGERDAVRALMDGTADAACILGDNHLLFSRDGTLRPPGARVLAETAPYDHCIMTVAVGRCAPSLVDQFTRTLLAMDMSDPIARRLLDLEGLTQWVHGRQNRYAALESAVDLLGFADATGSPSPPAAPPRPADRRP